ncbi:glycogen synthase [Patescibacteria group bacterium]
MIKKTKNPKVFFISAEVAPFAKVGGLADVAGALPPALANLGVDISVMMPLYGNIKKIFKNKKLTAIECNEKKYLLENVVENFTVEFDGKNEKINVYKADIVASVRTDENSKNSSLCHSVLDTESRSRSRVKRGMTQGNQAHDCNSVPIYFIDNKKYFGGKDIYHPPVKFLFFSKAVAEIIADNFRVDSSQAVFKRGNAGGFAFVRPDIIHCNDNHTAFISALLKNEGLNIKTVLTIHNLQFQGQFSTKKLKSLNILLNSSKHLEADSRDGDINKMAQGILSSEVITTVSPTYAKEILTKQCGEGLDNILKMRKNDLYGIINGIDVDKFNPETDSFIKYNYSVKDLDGKRKNKEDLLKEYFGATVSQPLIGLISRLASQKGIDLVIDAIPQMFKKYPNLFFILLGTGNPEYETKLKELGKKYPYNFKPLIKFDLKIAQRIYAGSDIFLMPSKFEPCGLGQLTAMRYGTVPIVRKTGGLADTVNELKVHKVVKSIKSANGFVFERYFTNAMLKIIDYALEVYQNKKMWEKIMLNGMKRDSSWGRSAKEYLKIYKKLIK